MIMWMALLKPFGDSIVNGVISGVKEYNNARQIDRMQAEILDGWLFKIKVAVERKLKEGEVDYETFKSVMDAIDAVVIAEFDVGDI